jgi:hypothetical protein
MEENREKNRELFGFRPKTTKFSLKSAIFGSTQGIIRDSGRISR